MIATVTLNPAIDKTMSIPGFGAGKTNRATVEQIDAGGKGINVAKALRQFGCPVTALGFLAGNNGRTIADALAASSIPADFIWVAGDTRVNLKIKDPLAGTETEINEPGFPVEAEQIEALGRKIEAAAAECEVIVFSGSLPPGAPADTYGCFLRAARSRGARTILDTAGAALRHGLAAAPHLIKPNRAEAEEVLGAVLDGEPALVAGARRLQALGAGAVIISLGPDGALAAEGDEIWRAVPPAIAQSSSIGAGDAMVAALAWSMTRSVSLGDALRLAVAAGAASAETNGSAADLARIHGLLPRIVLKVVTS